MKLFLLFLTAGIDSNSIFDEDSEACKKVFEQHPHANCVLFSDEDCLTDVEDGTAIEPAAINRAITYLDLGLASRLSNEIESISVRKGCSLKVYSGNTILIYI